MDHQGTLFLNLTLLIKSYSLAFLHFWSCSQTVGLNIFFFLINCASQTAKHFFSSLSLGSSNLATEMRFEWSNFIFLLRWLCLPRIVLLNVKENRTNTRKIVTKKNIFMFFLNNPLLKHSTTCHKFNQNYPVKCASHRPEDYPIENLCLKRNINEPKGTIFMSLH